MRKSLVLASLLVSFLAGGILGWSIWSRMIFDIQGYSKLGGSGFTHPTSETYATVNAEANLYLRELISGSSLGWDLSDWRLGDMCFVVPVSNGYDVVFWCGSTQRRVPPEIIEKLNLFLMDRLEKGTQKTQQRSGANRDPLRGSR